MIKTIISANSGFATGINVFQLPDERRSELLEALHAMNELILREKLSMIVASNFHVGIDGPVVINYNQYTDRKLGQVLRTIPDAVPITKRTHDVADHQEIRWYDVAEVITARPPAGEIHVTPGSGEVAAIGIYTVAPEQQNALLAALKNYGEDLADARTRGFRGIAIHRGHKPEHVASYEQWESAEAYELAGIVAAAAARDRIRSLADECLLHTYEVVEQARFDLGEIVAAGSPNSD